MQLAEPYHQSLGDVHCDHELQKMVQMTHKNDKMPYISLNGQAYHNFIKGKSSDVF